MIHDTLQAMHDDGDLTVPEICDLLNLGKSSAYRLFNETELRYSQLRTLLRHARPAARKRLLADLISGLPVQVVEPLDDLDTNHDGRVDAWDALGQAIEAVTRAAAASAKIRDAVADGQVEEHELLLCELVQGEAMSALATLTLIVQRLARATPQRRQARRA
jgi:hypothetical protein